MNSTELFSALEIARIGFQDESKCFMRDDNTTVTKHDMYILACAINTVLAEFQSLIAAEFQKR